MNMCRVVVLVGFACVLFSLKAGVVAAEQLDNEGALAQTIAVDDVSIDNDAAADSTESAPVVDTSDVDQDATTPKARRIPSLFFTLWQYQSIQDAKNSKGYVRAPTDSELNDQTPPEPGLREISLGGIAYRANDDWTVWMNGQRVTPQAIPKEVLDLKVYKNFIEVKWLDEYTNRIFPLRLRPHQRFHLDQRLFLTGDGE